MAEEKTTPRRSVPLLSSEYALLYFFCSHSEEARTNARALVAMLSIPFVRGSSLELNAEETDGVATLLQLIGSLLDISEQQQDNDSGLGKHPDFVSN